MTKKQGIFGLGTDTKVYGQPKSYDVSTINTIVTIKEEGKDLDSVIEIIIQQMEVSGYRERTVVDYTNYMAQFRKATNVKYLEEITTDTIYSWLNSMDVSNQTKLTRLKCLKAILGKCFNNGWVKSKFWHGIN